MLKAAPHICTQTQAVSRFIVAGLGLDHQFTHKQKISFAVNNEDTRARAFLVVKIDVWSSLQGMQKSVTVLTESERGCSCT